MGSGMSGPHLRLGSLRRGLVMAAVLVSVLVPSAAFAHGAAFDIVVEAVVRDPVEPGSISYGIALTFADGDPVTGATITVVAGSAAGATVNAVAAETVDGVYIADLSLPSPGTWRVEVTIDHPETAGVVSFDEVNGPAPAVEPVVRVDTARPERQGTPVGSESAVFPDVPETASGGEGPPLRVEALVREAVAPLIVEYGVAVEGEASTIAIEAVSEAGERVSVALSESAPRVFTGVLSYPAAAVWTVEVSVTGPAPGTYAFKENLPWPHYSIEAGFPKVKVDTADPASEGTLIDLEDSAIFAVASTTTTAPSTPTTTVGEGNGGSVTVALPDNAAELRRQVIVRWGHTAAIAVWVVGIILLALGRNGAADKAIVLFGIVAVVSTGLVLVLYGAPTTYPGLFRWSDLSARFYGPSYQWAFIAKMAFVLIAIVGTAALTMRRWGAVLATIGIVGALASVVAMLQFHLFAHL